MFRFKINIPGQITNKKQALCLKTIVVLTTALTTNTDGWGNKLVTVFAGLTPACNKI